MSQELPSGSSWRDFSATTLRPHEELIVRDFHLPELAGTIAVDACQCSALREAPCTRPQRHVGLKMEPNQPTGRWKTLHCLCDHQRGGTYSDLIGEMDFRVG